MFKIIIITSPHFLPDECKIINSLFAAGLQRLHLRKPLASFADTERFILSIDSEYYNRIVLHDWHELAMKYNLGGIHLNKRNPYIKKSEHTFKNNLLYTGSISRSCHSLKELEEKKHECSYLSLSPVFNSISKEGYISAFSAKELKDAAAKSIIDEKVYALGGVTSQNITILKEYGFGGAMLLGYIWNDNGKSALYRFNEIQSLKF